MLPVYDDNINLFGENINIKEDAEALLLTGKDDL